MESKETRQNNTINELLGVLDNYIKNIDVLTYNPTPDEVLLISDVVQKAHTISNKIDICVRRKIDEI